MSSGVSVLHFDSSRNFLEAGLDTYLVLCDSDGVTHAIPAKCAHRGGPLHLGSLDASQRFIVCPWHKNKTSLGNTLSRALPTIRAGGRISVVFPASGPPRVDAIRRTHLLDCAAAICSAVRAASGTPR